MTDKLALQLKGVSKTYADGTEALKHIDLEVAAGSSRSWAEWL